MASRAAKIEITEIDPVFSIPDGVDELVYTNGAGVAASPEDDDSLLDVDIDIDTAIDDSSADDDTDYADAPETPQILGIIAQEIRTDSTGTEVVDVIFDISDVFNTSNYEIRVTPL